MWVFKQQALPTQEFPRLAHWEPGKGKGYVIVAGAAKKLKPFFFFLRVRLTISVRLKKYVCLLFLPWVLSPLFMLSVPSI